MSLSITGYMMALAPLAVGTMAASVTRGPSGYCYIRASSSLSDISGLRSALDPLVLVRACYSGQW